MYDLIPNFFQVYMNTLLEPPSSFFQPAPCNSSLFAIERASRFSSTNYQNAQPVGFSALTFSKMHCVNPTPSPPCIRQGKSFSLTPFVLNIKSAIPSRDSFVRANHSFTLIVREIE